MRFAEKKGTMKKCLKWVLIITGSLFVVFIAILFILPRVVDIESYKPVLEKQISEAVGRSFFIDDLEFTLIPDARVKLTGLRMGNPPGYSDTNFMTIQSFGMKLKLVPLLYSRFKDIRIDQFHVNGLHIILEKKKDGSVNWQRSEQKASRSPKTTAPPVGKESPESPKEKILLESITGEKWMVENGSVVWIDQSKNVRREISDLNMTLKHVSLERPMHFTLSTLFDGKPLFLDGRIGPMGRDPGKGKISFSCSAQVFNVINLSMVGHVVDPRDQAGFAISIDVRPFSVQKLLAAVDPRLSIKTGHLEALNRVSLNASVHGNGEAITFSKAVLRLDETEAQFSARIKGFASPDITFDANIDQIDWDRYRPLEFKREKEKKETPKENQKERPVERPVKMPQKRNYKPLRELILDGKLKINELKFHNARLSAIRSQITAKNGFLRVAPLEADLYDGRASVKASLDFRKDMPVYYLHLTTDNIRTGPLLRDIFEKDILESRAKSRLTLAFAGEQLQTVKKNLSGKGEILFTDGVIKGIDLPAMLRNVEAAFDQNSAEDTDRQTEFTELRAPLTIEKGIIHTSDTTLKAPSVDANASGTADLNTETLDFLVEPRFRIARQRMDQENSTHILVPIQISGSFSKPRFRPDLSGILKQNIGAEVIEEQLKKLFKKERYKPYEESARELLKKLLQE